MESDFRSLAKAYVDAHNRWANLFGWKSPQELEPLRLKMQEAFRALQRALVDTEAK